jgi:hypothetical protein
MERVGWGAAGSSEPTRVIWKGTSIDKIVAASLKCEKSWILKGMILVRLLRNEKGEMEIASFKS